MVTSAYVHIPFCLSKCRYCDFNSHAGLADLHSGYIASLLKDVESSTQRLGQPLRTIYIGGGTPTLLPPQHLRAIIHALTESCGMASECEVTVEANPRTIDSGTLANMRLVGVNRLSIGVQSMDNTALRVLGRAHEAEDAAAALQLARERGFHNVSVDLIYGIPGQSLRDIYDDVEHVILLGPEHVSAYELTVEEGTPLAVDIAEGRLRMPDTEMVSTAYDLVGEALSRAGYEHYEVSSYAKPGFRSRHNQVYWRNEPHYGFGAGAWGYVDGVRTRRIPDPRGYIEALEAGLDPVESTEELRGRALLAETLMLGLRMLDGVDLDSLVARGMPDARREFPQQIDKLIQDGLVDLAGSVLKPSYRGLRVLNDVVLEFFSTSEKDTSTPM